MQVTLGHDSYKVVECEAGGADEVVEGDGKGKERRGKQGEKEKFDNNDDNDERVKIIKKNETDFNDVNKEGKY